MVPLVPMVPLAVENVQGFLVTIGKNGTNSTIGRFSERAFVVFSNGKNGTIGRQIPFKVLPMVPLVMPLVPMVPMSPTYGSKWCRQNTAWVILPTREKSRDSIWQA